MDVFKYYTQTHALILSECIGRNIGIRLNNGFIKRHYSEAELNYLKYNGYYFKYDTQGRTFYQITEWSGNLNSKNPQDLSYIIANGGIEIHKEVTLIDNLYKSNVFYIDLDPIGPIDFEIVKKFTMDFLTHFKKIKTIKNIKIRFSGNRSFHFECYTYGEMELSEFKKSISEKILDFRFKECAFFTERFPNISKYIYVDLGALAPHKMIRCTGSLHHKTNEPCIYVEESSILDFKRGELCS